MEQIFKAALDYAVYISYTTSRDFDLVSKWTVQIGPMPLYIYKKPIIKKFAFFTLFPLFGTGGCSIILQYSAVAADANAWIDVSLTSVCAKP